MKRKTIEQLTYKERLEKYRENFRQELMWFRQGERDRETLLDEIIATISVEVKRGGN